MEAHNFVFTTLRTKVHDYYLLVLRNLCYIFASVVITTRHSKTIFLGDWSSWQEWGGCTVSCGGGIQNRHRLCLNPTPMHGGLPCSMDGSKNVELRTCNVNMCPGMYEISIEKVPPV